MEKSNSFSAGAKEVESRDGRERKIESKWDRS